MLTVVTISAMQRRAREWQARRIPVAFVPTMARPDHIEFFDPQTLLPVRQVRQGTRLALAVFIGQTRLIDNAAL